MESPTLLEVSAPVSRSVSHRGSPIEWPIEIPTFIPSPLASGMASACSRDGRDAHTGPEEHDYFSFEDGNITFRVSSTGTFTPSSYLIFQQVENTLFTIHRYFFQRDSQIFSEMFSLPISNDASSSKTQGTKEDPIHLPTLTMLDFERFLKILYPPYVFGHYATLVRSLTMDSTFFRRFGQDNLTSPEEWVSVLRVADMYLFDDVRQLAIQELLLNCPEALRIQLGHRYKVYNLAFTGYKAICNRDETLRSEEVAMLSPLDVALIMEIRENWWKNGAGYNRYRMGETKFLDESIRAHFALRLQSI